MHQSIAQALLAATIFVGLVPNASVSEPITYSSSLLVSCAIMIAAFAQLGRQDVERSAGALLVTGGLAVLYSMFQSRALTESLESLGNTAWYELQSTLGSTDVFISVNPGRSAEAITRLSLPILILVSTLLLAQTRRGGRQLWHWMTACGLLVAFISTMLELFVPDAQWFSSRSVGMGGMNGVFINRNVAGAFLTMTAFAVLGSILLSSRQEPPRRWVSDLKTTHPRPQDTKRFFLLMSFFALLTCIVLTQSRAAVGFGVSSLSLAAAFALVPDRIRNQSKLLIFALLFLTSLMLLTLFLGIFGVGVLSRFETDDTLARWCVFHASWQAYRQEPIFGYGFATFQDVFPMYRPVECVGDYGVWLRAHNSFIEVILGSGFFGMVLILIFFLIIACLLWVPLRTSGTSRKFAYLVLFLCCYLSAHSFFDFPLQMPGLSYYFAALLGCGLGLARVWNSSSVGERRVDEQRRSDYQECADGPEIDL